MGRASSFYYFSHFKNKKKLFIYIYKVVWEIFICKKYILLFLSSCNGTIDLLTRCYHHHHSFTIHHFKKSLSFMCVCVCYFPKPITPFFALFTTTTITTKTTTILVFVFSGREQNVRKKKRLMVTAIPRGKHHFSPDQWS